MYCPLQEAYQIPTFASKRRRGCAAGPQAPAQNSLDGYDPMGVDEGLAGKAPAYRRYSREDFTNPPTRSGNAMENRDITGNPSVDNLSGNYTAEAADIQYYSKYALQFPQVAPLGGVEGFADTDAAKCAPHDTTYKIPISDETKKAYNAAFNVALNQTQGQTSHTPPPKMRTADMSKVTGFYDEDLESYLKTADIKAAPMSSSSAQAQAAFQKPYNPDSSPFANALAAFKGQLTPASEQEQEQFRGSSKSLGGGFTNDSLADLILFILCGILVVFLCDQLYRLAVLTGMRDTLEFIRPYINAVGTPAAA